MTSTALSIALCRPQVQGVDDISAGQSATMCMGATNSCFNDLGNKMSEIIDGQIVLTCPRCHGSGIDLIETCGFCEGAGKVAIGGLTEENENILDNEAYKIEWK
jgi:RecJ-like exonuclease